MIRSFVQGASFVQTWDQTLDVKGGRAAGTSPLEVELPTFITSWSDDENVCFGVALSTELSGGD